MNDVAVKITGVAPVGKIAMPEPAKPGRGSTSKYPFDSLEAKGQFFGVEGKTAKEMASVISNQNKRHREEKKDANGNVVYKTKELKQSDGTVTKVPDTEKPEMVSTKHYFASDVDDDTRKKLKGTEWEKATCLVWRDI